MILVGCPNCGWPLILPDRRLGIHHRCLNCEHAFDTHTAPVLSRKGQRQGEQPAPPSAPPEEHRRADHVRLTAAHHCTHCGGSLSGTGLRRSSVDCPHCQRNTSVYAVLHHCPECATLLESPLSQQGTLGSCPACGERLTIPFDVLFNDGREQPDHTWFSFACPNCRQELRSKPGDANKTAVCPLCLRPQKIPAAGEPVVPQLPPLTEDLAAEIEAEIVRHCPRCGLQMAARSRVCRSCGAQRS